jgi:hypothetical protein
MPSSARNFQFGTNVGIVPSFTLSDSTPTQLFNAVYDGSYDVTLAASQTTGYDVVVTCVGAGTYLTSTDTTTFSVAGDDVTCTFKLTGMLTVKRDSVVVSSYFRATQTNCRRLRATTSMRRPLPARAKAARRLRPLPSIRIPMRNRPRHVITSTARCSTEATRLLRAKPLTALIKRVSFCALLLFAN